MLRIMSTLSPGGQSVAVSVPASVPALVRRPLPAVSLPSVLTAVPSSLFTASQTNLMIRPVLRSDRHYSTFSDMYRTAQQTGMYDRVQNIGILFLMAAGAALFGYKVFRDNNPTEVVDHSVLGDELENTNLFVINAKQLKKTETGEVGTGEVTTGRSGGHMVRLKHSALRDFYYYFKMPFGRDLFFNELVLGALGREIFKTTDCPFPKVFAVESPITDADKASKYSFVSENIGGNQKNYNLEEFVLKNAATGFSPDDFRNLGVVLAFDMLFGHSDCKLANIVRCSSGEQHCYAIDHESAFSLEPKFVISAKEAVLSICEFGDKTYSDRLAEQSSEGAIDADENFRQPLKSNKKLKKELRPVLEAAIQEDINSGAVNDFYKKFVALSEDQIKLMASKFGSLLHDDEQASYVQAIQARQAELRKFLREQIEAERRVIFKHSGLGL